MIYFIKLLILGEYFNLCHESMCLKYRRRLCYYLIFILNKTSGMQEANQVVVLESRNTVSV